MSFSFERCISKGFNAFGAHAGPLLGGFIILFLIYFIAQMIPVINVLFMLIICPALEGGRVILLLKALRNRQPEVSSIFRGFDKFGQFLGAYWFYVLLSMIVGIIFAIVIAFLGLLGFSFASLEELRNYFHNGLDPKMSDMRAYASTIMALLPAVIILFVIALLVLVRWSLVYYIIADDLHNGSVLNAFTLSSKLTSGNLWKLIGALIVISVFVLVGLVVFFVGVIFTSIIGALIYASIYDELRESKLGVQSANQTLPENPAFPDNSAG